MTKHHARHARPARVRIPAVGTLTAVAAASVAVWHPGGHAAAAVPPAISPPSPGHSDAHQLMSSAVRPLVTRVRSASTGTQVTVRSGDTLSGIAGQLCGSDARWPSLAAGNDIANANLIVPGEAVKATCSAVPRPVPAAPAPARSDPAPAAPVHAAAAVAPSPGSYGCGALESLWESAGGSAGLAVTMASIAMAESGGNPGAVSPTDDFGLWQDHADPAALSPAVSAEVSVKIEETQGLSAWTTYTSGAYAGRC
jgi:hypothetical protein